jgi:LXG domain of WXG superfamily/Pre-toxin TG
VSRQVVMREVNELYIAYSQFANETITQLTELQKSIESFQQLEGFTGQAAASAKAYMSEVHGAIIQSFMLVLSDIQVTFTNMIKEFENSVDNNKEAIIHTDHFIDLKKDFRQHNHQFLDIHHDLLQTIQQVSDIVCLNRPNSTRIEEMYYNMNTEISNRDLDVEAFDSMNRDKMNASADLLQSITNSMNEIKASISTPTGIQYTLGDIATSSWGARLGDTARPVSKQLDEQLEIMKENVEIAKANAPEERNGFVDFLGEMLFVYDIERLATGKDPVTGEEIGAFEIGLAAAGFIPIGKFTKLGKVGKFGDEALDVGKGVDEEELLEKIEDVADEIDYSHLSKAEFYTSKDIQKIINDKGYSVDEIVKLLHPNKVLNESEEKLIHSLRNEIGLPSAGTVMNKVIPQSDIYKYLYEDYKAVRGFTAVKEHGGNLKTLDEKFEGARLDYDNTAFKITNGVDGISKSVGKPDRFYGTIEYKITNVEEVSIPNWKPNGNDYPYTGKGFTGSRNIVLPEYYQQERKFLDGDLLNIIDSKTGGISRQFEYNIKYGWVIKE